MSETKAAFAERTIRSIKNNLYRYMEDFGYKYIHKLPQFITTLNSRIISSIDMRPNAVKNCHFKSILYSKLSREYKKHTFQIGDRVRFSKYDLPFCQGYKPQFSICNKKKHQHTQSRMSRTRLFKANFIKKS